MCMPISCDIIAVFPLASLLASHDGFLFALHRDKAPLKRLR